MLTSASHIALVVPNLQKAERFYQDLFEMELIGREMEKEDGLGYTLPFDKGWEDVKTAGISHSRRLCKSMDCYLGFQNIGNPNTRRNS